ncbi:hypothetical protein PENSPDRAFT_751452 [Peniophora sp. CONT]|nr:hypothetical protein PENSPDRAFT_751452 [Peniophora sp. CONT]
MAMTRRFVHFGGGPDPRHDSFIIGESPAGNDLYITFDTPPTRYDSRVITQVHRALNALQARGEVFAELRWFGTALGTFTSKTREGELHMGQLADISGRPEGRRGFVSTGDDRVQATYAWVRVPGPAANSTNFSYDLVHEPSAVPIGYYRYHGPQVSPTGVTTFATFEYQFSSETLLLDAMLALCINRFLDWMNRRI